MNLGTGYLIWIKDRANAKFIFHLKLTRKSLCGMALRIFDSSMASLNPVLLGL